MNTVPWTLEDLARTLREIAAEDPEYVYGNPGEDPPSYTVCWYAHANGEPGCIFGVALSRLGVDLGELTANRPISWYLELWFQVSGSDGARQEQLSAFRQVQIHQDARKPWGEAVKALDELFPL